MFKESTLFSRLWIFKFFLIYILLQVFSATFAQDSLILNGKTYFKYDKRLVSPSRKMISEIAVSTHFCRDFSSSWDDGIVGNIDTGLNAGIGLGYYLRFAKKNSGGGYLGVSTEYYPDQFQKILFSIGYNAPNPFKFIAVFSRFDFFYSWDLNSNSTLSQKRLYFINLRYKSFNTFWGIQFPHSEWFDNTFHVFQLSYHYQFKKW